MKGIIIHCAQDKCHKPLIRNSNLPIGSYLEVKCAHCGRVTCVCSNQSGVKVIPFRENLPEYIDRDLSNKKKVDIIFTET